MGVGPSGVEENLDANASFEAAVKRKKIEHMELIKSAELRGRDLPNGDILDMIIESKREIIASITRQSANRVQYNTGDRDAVLRATEVMS